MNFFGIHFCQDEAYALLSTLAFIGPMIVWARRKIWELRYWRAARKAKAASNCSSWKDS